MIATNFYDGKVKLYRINARRKALILQLIRGKNLKILEIGCGCGDLASDLKKMGHLVTGVDISKEAIDIAIPFLTKGFVFNIEDEAWPEELSSQKFDIVIASEVIEHIFLPDILLVKIKKALNENGKVLITIPNFLFWKNRLKMLLGLFEYTETGLLDFGHIRFFTLKTARKLFNSVGFKIEQENHFYPNLYKRGLNSLGSLLSGPLAYQLIFLLSNDNV